MEMREIMKPIGQAVLCLALFAVSAAPAIGQSTARINGIRGSVEIADPAGNAAGLTSRTPGERDTIRTGANSAVTLIIGTDISIVLGERTEVEIRRLGVSPVLWFERGDIQVSSKGPEVQIQAKSGWFSAEEWPFEMEMVNEKEATNITVTAGAVRTQNLDTSNLTFRAAGNNAYRTYSVGGNRQHDTQVQDGPPMFIRPVINVGGQSGSQTPAGAVTPGSKQPAPDN
jgi:hypothetical protein